MSLLRPCPLSLQRLSPVTIRNFLHPPTVRGKLSGRTCSYAFLLPPRAAADAGRRESLSLHRGSMDMFWCLPLTLLLLHQATCTNDRAEVTRATGRSVTFFLKNLDGEAAAWSFHDDVIVTVKFGNPPEAIFLDQKYKPRLTFPKNGSALTISQLTRDDAGTYTAKTLGIKTTFTLHVYRELAVPTVTCTTQNCSADGCLYTLHCAASGSGYGNVSYSWSMGDLPWREGPTVVVEESPPGEPPPLLTCMARNPVSSHNTSVILPAALCAGAYSSRWAGIVVTSLIGVGLLLAVLIFMICYKSKGWRIFSLPAAEVRNVVSSWKTSCQPTEKELGAQP